MLFPLFALYYKIGNNKKAKEYLNRINKCRGDSSEIFMYWERYDYLLITMPKLHEYVVKNLMKNKNSINNKI